ncbi:MAG: TonB-dependent receptor [Betaproteobacteria bacterium]|nr:MAG: TonB-dependent receptor [Betaproteobacteria bacterium]
MTDSGNGAQFTIADAAGGTRAWRSGAAAGATDRFNFSPFNYYRRPSEQISFNTFAHLDLHPKVRAYTELGFHDNKTDAQIAPSGFFFGNTATIHGDNPLLSAAEKALIAANNGGAPFAGAADTATLLIGRRNVEGPGRDDNLRHSSYRAVLGAKGDLSPVWSYDTYFQTATVIYSDTYRNDFLNSKVRKALDVTTDPATGLPVCRSVLDGSDPNCVPWNVWRLGGVTQGALNYLNTPLLQNGSTRMNVIGATTQADLGKYGWRMPRARDGLAFAFGVERRKETLDLVTDNSFETGDGAGQGGPQRSVSGKLDVDEWFTEARLPIAQRVPLADLLSVNASYRRSNYSTGKSTNTYGFGGEWAPVRNYRARASYQRAVRHANIQELFQPQGNNLFGLSTDPCSGTQGAPKATLAQCLRTGLPAALYGTDLDNSAGQYNYVQGGNPDLIPEKADTYTLGLVMTPARNLTASIDWWNIKIDQAIGAVPAFILVDCLNSGHNCNNVHRDTFGTLWLDPAAGVTALNTNFGGYNVRGIDLAGNYTMRLGNMGGFGINALVTWLDKWEFEPVKGAGKFDCKGLYGPMCSNTGGPNPEWKSKLRGTWATPWNVDLALTWRHISEVKYEATSSDPLLRIVGSTFSTNEKLKAVDYFDIAALWNINKTFSLRAGINNLFDVDPPIVGSGTADPSIFGNGNTFPGTYDTLGRLVFMNLTMKF